MRSQWLLGMFVLTVLSSPLAHAVSGGPDDSTWVYRVHPQTAPGYSTVCGSTANGVCSAMHGSAALGAFAGLLDGRFTTPEAKAIRDSSNPDVSVEKYLKIEKAYAARGEPLNVESAVKFMAYLAKAPSAKCNFALLGSSGGYGLSCKSPGDTKAKEFPGLTEKFLNEYFPTYNENPPEQADTDPETDPDPETQPPNPEDITLPSDPIPIVEDGEAPEGMAPASVEDSKPRIPAAVR